MNERLIPNCFLPEILHMGLIKCAKSGSDVKINHSRCPRCFQPAGGGFFEKRLEPAPVQKLSSGRSQLDGCFFKNDFKTQFQFGMSELFPTRDSSKRCTGRAMQRHSRSE